MGGGPIAGFGQLWTRPQGAESKWDRSKLTGSAMSVADTVRASRYGGILWYPLTANLRALFRLTRF